MRDQKLSVLLCGKDGRWKTDLEELLRLNQSCDVVVNRRRKTRHTKLPQRTSKHPDNRDVHQIYQKEREGTWLKSKGQVKRKGLTLKQVIKELGFNEHRSYKT